MAKHVPYPEAEFMKKFKEKKRGGKFPPPDECIMEMVNSQLKVYSSKPILGDHSKYMKNC